MNCPFCDRDPFHYVHNGLGMEAVAVTCCDLGVELYRRDPPETLELGYDELRELAQKLTQKNREIDHLRDAIAAIQQATIDGRVCDDVAWFSEIETLHDFCENALEWSPEQTELL